MAAELTLAQLAVSGGDDRIPVLVVIHVVLAGVSGASASWLYRRGEHSPIFLLFVVSVIALGPIGAAGSTIAALLHLVFVRRAIPFERWYASLFPGAEHDQVRALYATIALRGAGPGARCTAAPFTDILALGTVKQKETVITLITDNFIPAFSIALRRALNDAEPAIRVQAASAAARIENQFLVRSMAIAESRAAPRDEPERLLNLARLYDEYVQTGLMDETRANATRQQALELYEVVLSRGVQNPSIVESLARLLIELGRADEAVIRLEAWLAKARSTRLLARYIEGLFALRRYDQIRKVCIGFVDELSTADLPDGVRESISLWSAPGAIAEEARAL
ncbi:MULTISPECIES: tetratricopeptide repeat protein [unclassified Bradyrhizobium]|uniref:tetratricopeptide repeat protein n=1 Tax=unclassified Bradyrhizobium TaxID=2631580 RepID=UPI0012EB5E75|nr:MULTISPECIES: tetratricopeptide repeat protein [unclassified Bradyrhizobium]MCK7667461.1 hypothetical protein [Bradyrhizobium sp. 2S1]QIG94448.1 tetratricopeptide repeat protein [Bradyrhizobium sp. 6(2017)]